MIELDARTPYRGTRLRVAMIAILMLTLISSMIGCSTSPDERTSQILNQRGFGRKYVGDANERYYLGINDAIAVTDPLYPEITSSYVIGADGTINVESVGEVYVAGMTISEVTQLLNERYREIIESASVHVRVLRSASKFYYVHGEAGRVGVIPFRGDTTLFDVVIQANPRSTANLRRVRLIRGDPVHPLVLEFDYKDMLLRGFTGGNVLVRENDIVYIPPNFLGQIGNVLSTLLSPLQVIVTNILTLNSLVVVSESFAEDDRFVGFGGFGGFGGRGLGGFNRRGVF